MKVTVKDVDAVAQTGTSEVPTEVIDLNTFVDTKGRVFNIQPPDILMEARFERLFGAENDNYRFLMGALVWIRSIDGESVSQPHSILAYEALLQRVGEDAFKLLTKRVVEINAAKTAGTKEEVKNS